MNPQPTLRITTLAALLSTAFVVACSDSSNQTAGEKLDQSVAMARQKGEQLGSDMKQGAAELKDQASSTTSSAKQAISDAAITAEINASLAKDPDLSAMKIDVDTAQGKVTLSGPAPNDAAQARATLLAQSVEGVTTVDNRLVVR